MNALQKVEYLQRKESERPIIIIGTGPVGIRLAQMLVDLSPDISLSIYGKEPLEPYDRVGLSSFLAGEITREQINNPLNTQENNNVTFNQNCEVREINTEQQYIVDQMGNMEFYRQLILAVGSSPHLPNIPGIKMRHVYTFRDMKDVDHLFARRLKTRCTVILGGGLLGLEAARAMKKYNTEVIIIEHAKKLMNNQLNNALSEKLHEEILSLGIKVMLNTSVTQVVGDVHVTGVVIGKNKVLSCDTLIVATGIRPNKKIAVDAGIKIGRGITVNNKLQTSARNVYAVGECVEHKNQVYGLVAPGYEQAAVLANSLVGNSSQYLGSTNAAKLKLFGVPVFSVGETGETAENISNQLIVFENDKTKHYRTLVIRHRRLVGAMGIGVWPEFDRIREAVEQKRRVWPWQSYQFKAKGRLWNEDLSENVANWPDRAIICNCKNLDKKTIGFAIANGAATVPLIQQKTGASTICGSCEPLLHNFVDDSSSFKTMALKGAVVIAKLGFLLGVMLFAVLLLPSIPFSSSVQNIQIDYLWTDFLIKQISGYSLLGLIFIGALLVSLKKRMQFLRIGELHHWRIAHMGMAALGGIFLFGHTGLRLGENINFMLMMCFLAVGVFGVVYSLIIANEHKFAAYKVKRFRNYASKAHIYLSWPLPVLVGFHILSVYYF